MAYYLVRVGEGSKYIDEAKRNGFVAIGCDDVSDIKQLDGFESIKAEILKNNHNYSPAQASIQAGQVNRFGILIQQGDVILSPLGQGKYLVGKSGEYFFYESPDDNCPYKHRRHVEWYDKILFKADMSTNLAYALGATLTVFSLDKYNDELDALIKGEEFISIQKPQKVRDRIVSSLMELDGKEFEEFIKHVLEVVGFSAETTQYVGDKGVDVNGTLDAEGLADITLRVQVKRVTSTIGIKDVLALKGTLGQGEHGCFITLSSFTAQAVEEAQAPGKVQIKLIDGNDLAGLILKQFDHIDGVYQRNFGIKRKDLNIEDQFELIN